jgi:two-component system cell cycle sensor histidine kinase/response regulator CckA
MRSFRRSERFIPAALVLLFFTGIFSFHSLRRFQASSKDVVISKDILNHASRLLAAITDAETGQRGFLLTGRKEYLQPFQSGTAQVPAELSALELAANSRAEQLARAEVLRMLVNRKLEELRTTLSLQVNSGTAAALTMVNTDAGKRTMDQIRAVSQKLLDSEYARLTDNARTAQSDGVTSLLVTTSASACLFTLLALAMVVINRASKHREQLIEELHERGELLHTTLTSIGDAVIVTDEKGNVTFQNGVSEDLTGWTLADAIGKPLPEVFDIVNEYTGEAVESPVTKVLREGCIVGLANHTVLLGRNGRRVPIEDSGAPIRNKDGALFGVVMVFRDVSENRKSEAQNRRLEEKLQETARLESLGVLAGGIAHDFNNLLVGIMGSASLALEVSTLQECRPLLRQVVQTSERAAHLTRQMLAYAGKGKILSEQIQLAEYVRETLPLMETAIARTIQLKLEISGDSLVISADPAQVQQILMNLVINAAEAYDGRNGTVKVAVYKQTADAHYIEELAAQAEITPGDYVCLEVSDGGCGMDKGTLSRIFDPFFTTKFSGRGLGLSAVAGIVRSHKGAIRVYSEPGAGTTFRVLLPAVLAVAAQRPAESTPPSLRGQGTVLVVDDEEMVRTLMKTALTHYGYRVLLAEDGEVALRILKDSRDSIEVVILDLTMPVKSGEETLRDIRQLEPGLPVLMTSGFSGTDAFRSFGQYGISGFIQKPYTAAYLAERVKGALDGVSKAES